MAQSPATLRLTISMPAYNEEEGIERAVLEALTTLDRLRQDMGEAGEVLVVDDGSTDTTPEILDRLRERDPRLKVHRHSVNQGIGGFNRALLSQAAGEWVFFIGADGEWDPMEALRFLELAESSGLDAVLGWRSDKRYSWQRKLISWSFNALVTVSFGIRIRDAGSIRLLRRSFFAPLPLYSQSAFLNAERLLVGRRLGARWRQVPVDHRPRLSGRGRGAHWKSVAAALLDLLSIRVRWFRFRRCYTERIP